MKRLSTKGQHFVDETGAQVLLSGINLVCKDPQKGFVEDIDESTFAWFQKCGFNLIRLGLCWEGVEPSPHYYDNVYLSKIAQQIKLAQKYGIYVFLDMHQDLYGRRFGNGAPEWATLSDGLAHIVGDTWSDSYLISPAVQCSIDHFWENAKVDGEGLQDYYAKMWGHTVDYMSQYAFSNLIGYDLMNEPFMGSQSQEVLGALLGAYAQTVLHMENPNMEELAGMWLDQSKQSAILADMADVKLYAALTQCASAPSMAFEREVLSPFYCKVAKEIRKYDPSSILLLESNYFCNMGIESGITAVVNDAGEVDMQQAYAPHGYDLVVDTDHYEDYNQDRVNFIFQTHQKTAKRLNVPVIVGEWGAFYGNKYAYDLTKDIVRIFESTLFSNTYWSYDRGMEKSTAPNALKRGYPMSSNCEILGYRYDDEQGTLEMTIAPKGVFFLRAFHPDADSLAPNAYVAGVDDAGIVTLIGEDVGACTLILQRADKRKDSAR